jgi:hypothetical protein
VSNLNSCVSTESVGWWPGLPTRAKVLRVTVTLFRNRRVGLFRAAVFENPWFLYKFGHLDNVRSPGEVLRFNDSGTSGEERCL